MEAQISDAADATLRRLRPELSDDERALLGQRLDAVLSTAVRTITDRETLDALPKGTRIVDAEGIDWVRLHHDKATFADMFDHPWCDFRDSRQTNHLTGGYRPPVLPAVVLGEPPRRPLLRDVLLEREEQRARASGISEHNLEVNLYSMRTWRTHRLVEHAARVTS